jgi:mRNA-degrading endonuclease toxin of MazEF toxin-antitoxin module
MKRGPIWTVAGSGDFDAKPRPVVILQDDRFDATDSVTVCALTSAQPMRGFWVSPSNRTSAADFGYRRA